MIQKRKQMKNFEQIINEFIEQMQYKQNEHFLGVYFYGSCLSGFNNDNSDIDLHIVFDNTDKYHIFRGIHYLNGNKIEYFEKTINDLYLSIDNDISDRNIAWKNMVAESQIIYDKTGELKKLQEYAKQKYSNGLPKLDMQDILEQIAIINNRMEKLKILKQENNESFYHLYHITIEKIRRLHHSINGYPKINTTKIYKVYKNDDYRKSYYKGEFVGQEFKNMYYELITDMSFDNKKLLQKLEEFYDYVKNGIDLPKGNYRIKIKSRNKRVNTKNN